MSANGELKDDTVEITANEAVGSGIRLGIAAALGQSFDGDRDLYDTFGWQEEPDEEDYLALYLRNPYANTVVSKPSSSTWRDAPKVKDKADEDDTEFEEAVKKADRELDIWSYSERIDHLAGIVNHGVMVLVHNDVEEKDDLSEPLDADSISGTGLDRLNQIRVYNQDTIEDIKYGEMGSGRWQLPEKYIIDISEDVDEETESETGSFVAHHSRVIDVPAQSLLDDEILARPRLEPVFNALKDIEKILGACSELGYRGADYGLHANLDPDKVDVSGDAAELTEEELQNYTNNLQNTIQTVGAEVNRLGGDVQDPSGLVDSLLSTVSAATGIPKRILEGNAAGDLASAQEDTKQYHTMIMERRRQYANPHIVRPLIQHLVDYGVIPEPSGDGFKIDWEPLDEPSESEEAEIQEMRSTVVKNVTTAVPELRGDRAEEYIETGEFPERDTPEIDDTVDESDEDVMAQFARLTDASMSANVVEVNGQEIDLTPPEAAQEAAQRALELRDEYGEDIAMTGTGWARAEQLASGAELSPEDVADGTDGMGNWWARHASDALEGGEIGGSLVLEADEPQDDASYVAGLGWGGEVGARWAERKKQEIESAREDGDSA